MKEQFQLQNPISYLIKVRDDIEEKLISGEITREQLTALMTLIPTIVTVFLAILTSSPEQIEFLEMVLLSITIYVGHYMLMHSYVWGKWSSYRQNIISMKRERLEEFSHESNLDLPPDVLERLMSGEVEVVLADDGSYEMIDFEDTYDEDRTHF